jgi:hypothetical protein
VDVADDRLLLVRLHESFQHAVGLPRFLEEKGLAVGGPGVGHVRGT